METAVVKAPSRWGVIFPFPLISGSFEGGRFSFQIRNSGPPESNQLLEPRGNEGNTNIFKVSPEETVYLMTLPDIK